MYPSNVISYLIPAIVIGVLLVFSVFFSSAEMAYNSASLNRIEKMAKEGKKSAKMALYLTNNYEFTVSSILFGNSLTNIGASAFTVILGAQIKGELGAAIATIILTVVIIIFSEFLPKAISKRFANHLVLIYAYPIRILEIIFFPIVWPISKLFVQIGKIFKKKKEEEDSIDDEVLQKMIDESEDEGILEEGEAEIVRSVIDLNDAEAYEIMTPRVDVFAINSKTSISELINNSKVFDFSRIPVYEETIDDIIGILPVKALFKAILEEKLETPIVSLLYTPLFIPRNTEVLVLLDRFKTTKNHIAIVIDEYGGTDGIITMEDILENIVGDIFDETDEIEEEIETEADGTFVIDGNMNLDDFLDLIEYKEDVDTSYTTIGGFCQEFVDGFAKVGDQFDFGGYHFTVLEADEFSVEKLRVKKIFLEEDK